MNHTRIFKKAIVDLTEIHGLPVLSKRSNISDDMNTLDRFEGQSFVWLLRTNGSILVPTKIGVEPTIVTHFLWSEADVDLLAFHFCADTGVVEYISFEAAESRIMELPAKISALDCKETIQHKVETVLRFGGDRFIWGVFDKPNYDTFDSWSEWLKYFNSSNNQVMKAFLGRALRFIAA